MDMRIHAMMLACALATSIGWVPAKAQTREDRTISDRIDQILQRLDSIEARLTKLEIEVHASGLGEPIGMASCEPWMAKKLDTGEWITFHRRQFGSETIRGTVFPVESGRRSAA